MTGAGAAPGVEPLDAEATAGALSEAVVGRLVSRQIVRVSGPDAESYLQGQCSQDLAAMAAGDSRLSLLLSPQGKLVALVRVVALAPGELVVEVEDGYGEVVRERLARFKLRVKATLELDGWTVAEVRGPEADRHRPVTREGGLVVTVDGRTGHGFDVVGPGAGLPAGIPAGDPAAFTAARIEAGVPAMGAEIDEGVIPQETGFLDETVSFAKGCYTGQELVARLDARGGHVPRPLRGVVVGAAGPGGLPAPGGELYRGERAVGTLTSVAWSYRLDAGVALAYVRREVEPPATVELRGADAAGRPLGPLPAEVVTLPL